MIPQELDPKEKDTQEQENDLSNDTAPVEEDGSPILDEEDLEENDLSEEEADDVEWEEGAEEGADEADQAP